MPKPPPSARAALLLLPCVLAAACAGPRLPPPSAPVPAPSVRSADDLLHFAELRRGAVRGMRALARLAYIAPEESRRARQIVLARRPDRLRVEVLSPLGTVFVLTTRDGRLAAYTRSESTMYRGRATAANLQRYAQVGLPVTTAVDLLLGTPPLLRTSSNVLSRDGGYTKLWQVSDNTVYVTWFLPNLDPIQYEQRDEEGRVLLRATYGEYAERQGLRLPTEVGIEFPAAHRRIVIELEDPEVNPALADGLFALDTPPGSKEVDLDEVAN